MKCKDYASSCSYVSAFSDNYMYMRLMIYRIYHRSLMQTEKSQPEGKRIMQETRFTEFPALSVDLLGLHRRPMFDYFSYL